MRGKSTNMNNDTQAEPHLREAAGSPLTAVTFVRWPRLRLFAGSHGVVAGAGLFAYMVMVFMGTSWRYGHSTVATGTISILYNLAFWLVFWSLFNRYANRWYFRELMQQLPAGDGQRASAPTRWPRSAGSALAGSAIALAERGWNGWVVVATESEATLFLEPISQPFEPRQIDEADPSFNALQDAAEVGNAGGAALPITGGFAAAMRRNIRLRGGWPIVAVILSCVALLILIAMMARVSIWVLAICVIWTAIVLLIPHRKRFLGLHQWFVVPGGLLLRRASWLNSRVELQLFRRHDCALAALLTRNVSQVAVSDGNKTQTMLVTRSELNIVLRAWLSPLEPPPLTRLSDYF